MKENSFLAGWSSSQALMVPRFVSGVADGEDSENGCLDNWSGPRHLTQASLICWGRRNATYGLIIRKRISSVSAGVSLDDSRTDTCEEIQVWVLEWHYRWNYRCIVWDLLSYKSRAIMFLFSGQFDSFLFGNWHLWNSVWQSSMKGYLHKTAHKNGNVYRIKIQKKKPSEFY